MARWWGAPVLVALAACGGASTSTSPADRSGAARDDLEARYARAVADARSGRLPATRELTSLGACGAGDAAVRVATWRDGPIPLAGGALRDETWVTVADELRPRCASFGLDGPALDLRIRQLLGLPPGWRSDRFAVFTVRCADIFRPCPDPETTDRSCERAFPGGVAPDHRAWIARQRATAFEGSPPFPWTALGYTYDWREPERSVVGISEFVVRRGAPVEDLREEATSAYCRRTRAPIAATTRAR